MASGDPAAGQPDVTDDSADLADALNEWLRRDRTTATAGRLVLPLLSTAYLPGDRIRGIAGQDLWLQAGGGLLPPEPVVRAVRHDLADQWHTTLELE